MEKQGYESAAAAAGADEAGCRAILDALGDAVLVHDAATGEIREVNRKFCELLGYSPDEARRLNIRDLTGDGQHLPEASTPGQDPGLKEWQVKDRSGRQFLVEARLTFPAFQGRQQVCAVLRDIGPRQQAEANREEIESLAPLVMEGALAGVYLIQDGKFRYVNSIMAQIFGYRPEEIIDRFGPLDLVHPEDRELAAANLRRRLSQEEAIAQYSLRGWRRDGSTIHCELLSRYTEYRGRPAILGILLDITKRKVAEEALKEAQERFRQLADNLEAVFWMKPVGRDGILYINSAYERIWGRSVASLVQDPRTWVDTIHPDDRPRLQAKGFPDTFDEFEFRVLRPDGEVRWINCRTFPVRNEHGDIYRVAGISVDITEHKLAEVALKASEANYRTIFNAVDDGIAVVDLETGNFLDVNQKWCRMTGFSPEEARGLNVAILCLDKPPYTPADAMHWIREASKLGPQVFEYQAKTREGRIHWVEVNLRRTVIGGQERLLAVIRDVSERHEAEEALRISEENYRTIFNSSTDGIAVVEIETGRFLDVNRRWVELSGYTKEEAAEFTFDTFCLNEPPFRLEDAWVWFRKAMEEGPQTFEWKSKSKGGELQFVEVDLKRTSISGKECILANVRDISERKWTEEALRDSEAKYRNLVEQIPAIVYIIAMDNLVGPSVYISPQIKDILGFTPEEWLATAEVYKKQIHPEDRDWVLTELLLSYSQGGPFSAEYRMLSKAGRVIWVRDESRAVYNSEGRPLYVQGVAIDVTKRKKAEEALREANSKLRALVQASPLAIVAMDLRGKVTSWNPAAERIFGWRQDEALGRAIPIMSKDKKEECENLWNRVRQGERLMGLELQRRRKDGTLIDVSLSTALLYDAAGQVAGAMGVFEDISARKGAEEALRESEARFRAMFEGAPIGIALIDLQRLTVAGNPALREMGGGYTEAEIGRIRGKEVTHPDDWEADNTLFTELLAGKGNRFQKETRYLHKQGHWFWTRLSVSLVRDATGQPNFAICMIEDITERKRAQEMAEEVRRQQEAILSNIPDIAWLKDRESRVIAVNEQYSLARGKPRQELVGKVDLEIWPPHLALKYRTDDLEVMQSGKSKRMEEPIVDHQGKSFWVETIKTPIFNEQGEVVGTTGIARDITERRRMEEALRKLSRALKAVTECDQALLRASNEAELLSEVCRIIVEVGGYRMAWVGYRQDDDDKSVRPVAQQGFDEGYMPTVRVTWADEERGRGPMGAAIRTGKPTIIRDTRSDPRFAPWREEALKRGYASVLGLPLGEFQPFGALGIYATEPNAFDDEEINLLIGLANDLAYGLKALRIEAERRRVEEALRDSERKYRSLMDAANDAIVLADSQGKITEVNSKAEELLGYSETELLGMSYNRIHPPQICDHVLQNFNGILSTGLGPLHECKVMRKDGRVVAVDIAHTMVGYGNKRVVQAVFRDITERQRAAEALKESEQKLRLLASQLLAVQEKERRRVSRELHDELGQALTVLKIHLVAIENGLRQDQEGLKVDCERLLSYIDGVIENVRRLSWDLSPSSLEDLGLSSSLKYLVEDICRNNHMLYSVVMDEIDHLFSPEARINIYRIFQECLTNIVRHAEASRIDVKVKKEADRVNFFMKDNGKGFDLKKVRSRSPGERGLGLTAMHERALMLEGTLDIRNRKGKGTEITLSIPIHK